MACIDTTFMPRQRLPDRAEKSWSAGVQQQCPPLRAMNTLNPKNTLYFWEPVTQAVDLRSACAGSGSTHSIPDIQIPVLCIQVVTAAPLPQMQSFQLRTLQMALQLQPDPTPVSRRDLCHTFEIWVPIQWYLAAAPHQRPHQCTLTSLLSAEVRVSA